MSSIISMPAKSTEEIVAAATRVFLRYGFRRTTMGDLADAAQMSRPALYLVFPSKEAVFTAVMTSLLHQTLAEIRVGMERLGTAKEKLTLAFELWSVRPFEQMLSSPDARDLYESSYAFATEVMIRSTNEFVGMVADVLDPLVRRQAKLRLSAAQQARVLVSALPGFKAVAKTTDELRDLIGGMLAISRASLDDDNDEGRRGQKRKKAPRR
jgi:AcrR family transcriptional regulator